jgi:hypothetical protein
MIASCFFPAPLVNRGDELENLLMRKLHAKECLSNGAAVALMEETIFFSMGEQNVSKTISETRD